MPDPQYEIGRLAQAVETLTEKVSTLESKFDLMNAQMNKGKGFVFGMLVAAGTAGAGLATAFAKILGK